MLMTRWEPLAELGRLSREMERMFSRDGGSLGHLLGANAFPALNVWEDAEQLYVEAELPGFELEDLEIYVTGNHLSIRGQRNAPKHEGGTWHRQERSYGAFSRSFELPSDIDGDRVNARFHDGVLRIELPKSEAVRPKRIEVHRS